MRIMNSDLSVLSCPLMICKGCRKEVKTPADCFTCQGQYHPKCTVFTKSVVDGNTIVRCKICVSAGLTAPIGSVGRFVRPTATTIIPVPTNCPQTEKSPTLDAILEAIAASSKKIDGLLTLPQRVEEISAQLNVLSTTTANLVADLTTKVDVLAVRVTDLEASCGQERAEVARLTAENLDLSHRLQMLEQNAVNCDLIISGVPELPAEDLQGLFCSLATHLSAKILPADIIEITRIKSTKKNSDKPRTILARLRAVECRNCILAAKRTKGHIYADDLGLSGDLPHSPIFVNERLCSATAKLLSRAKERAREVGYRFIWTKNGRILAKRDQMADHVITIRTEADLELLTRAA